MRPKKICVFVGSRANWGRLKSVCEAITQHEALELQLILGASFYNADVPYNVDSRIQCLINADDHESMTLTTGILLTKVSMELSRLKPDIVLVHGDRYEVLAVAQAAAYQNIPLAHTECGEVTGCIDDKVRDAITALADIHFTVTSLACQNIHTHRSRGIYVVGSTALDGIKHIPDIRKKVEDYILVLFHPNTTENESIDELIKACNCFGCKKIWVNPNVDAGHMEILKELHRTDWGYVKNLSPEDYAKLIYNARCCVGNSSSFIKEASFLGTASVIVGNRQKGREVDTNVVFSSFELTDLCVTIEKQSHTRYEPSSYFGDGTASIKIADILAEVEV